MREHDCQTFLSSYSNYRQAVVLVPSYERDGRLYIIARLFPFELLGICREKKTSDFCWPFVIGYKKKIPSSPDEDK